MILFAVWKCLRTPPNRFFHEKSPNPPPSVTFGASSLGEGAFGKTEKFDGTSQTGKAAFLHDPIP